MSDKHLESLYKKINRHVKSDSDFWKEVSKAKVVLTKNFIIHLWKKLDMKKVFKHAELSEEDILEVIENMDIDFYDNDDLYLPIILKHQKVSEDFKKDFDCEMYL